MATFCYAMQVLMMVGLLREEFVAGLVFQGISSLVSRTGLFCRYPISLSAAFMRCCSDPSSSDTEDASEFDSSSSTFGESFVIWFYHKRVGNVQHKTLTREFKAFGKSTNSCKLDAFW